MGFFKMFKAPKSAILLDMPKTTLELGEEVTTTISVSSQEEFDAIEVRAELKCVEKRRRERWVYDQHRKRDVRRVYWDMAVLHSDNPKAIGSLHLVPGFRHTYSIRVGISAGGRESFDGLDGNISWFIKGVIAVKGRPDVTSETMELQVVKPLPESSKTKKVVMKSCEYCQTVMPETVTFCPTCGAPQKK